MHKFESYEHRCLIHFRTSKLQLRWKFDPISAVIAFTFQQCRKQCMIATNCL